MTDGSKTPIALPSRLDLVATETLLPELLDRVADADCPEADGSDVGLVDTVAIQLLLAARAELKKTGRTFRLRHPSEALEQAFTILGLQREFEDMRDRP